MASTTTRTVQVVAAAREYARTHPDQVRAALDSVERGVNLRTQGRYARVLKHGRTALEKQLGVHAPTVRSTAWARMRRR